MALEIMWKCEGKNVLSGTDELRFYANKIFNHLSDQLYDRLLEELVVPFEEAGDCVSIYEDCYNEYTSLLSCTRGTIKSTSFLILLD